MARKLQYFGFNGLAEAIRYLLHYGGLEFEDIRVDRGKWPNKEIKDKLPYGQMPVYQEGDRMINQNIAIARYVGSQVGLVLADPWEQAVLDAAVLNVNDFRLKLYPYVLENDKEKKAQMKEEFLREPTEFFLSRFEKELKNNNGYFGGKLSWADFYLVAIIEGVNLIMNVEVQKAYPAIAALMEKVVSLPGVKEYIEARGPYVYNY